ncbi:tetratricopeptide repeat protein [Thalassospira sp. MA62]|nr:tetratricopeptide repeat protein [Thalassospira sp. MA62]
MASFDQITRRAKKLEASGEIEEAAKLFEAFLADYPKNTRAKAALDRLRQGKSTAVKSPQERYALANSLIAKGDLARGIAQAQQLAKDVPNYTSVWNLLGMAYFQAKDYANSEKCLRKALELDQKYVLAWANIAVLFFNQGKMEQALTAFQNASTLDPSNTGFYNSISGILLNLGRVEEAEQACVRAITHNPDFAPAYVNLANILFKQNKIAGAKQAVEKAVLLDPSQGSNVTQYLYFRALMCDWSDIRSEFKGLDTIGMPGKSVSPFSMLHYEDHPENQLRRSQARSFDYAVKPVFPPFVRPSERPKKIKIGYFSADFHNHATLSLMMGLLEGHDRDRFEIHAYSYGTVKDGWRRSKLQEIVEFNWEVQTASDEDIVRHARETGIDIAIDLKGYTQEGRTSLFAHGLAPIQINYVGYPGSMGCDFMDYLIADHVVIPSEFRHAYSENIIYLPNSYQPNDGGREFPENTQTRAELGLPENGFVFCSFNANYKISAREFDIWMRLLQKVEGSVLWLLDCNEWARENLRKEAAVRGVDPSRLVFAARLREDLHLARHKHADLFLDSFNVNAHTTASDALWAGLPIVTVVGKQFAARVAASVLSAAGMSELITDTPEQYEELALELAQNRDKLDTVREKLVGQLSSCPLFDTRRYTRDLEAAYDQAYDRYFQGQAPADIDIAQTS